MKHFFISVWATLIVVGNALSTPSSTKSPTNSFLTSITDLFNSGGDKEITQKRENLKTDLIQICNDSSIKDDEQRTNVEEIIYQLKEISPITKTAISPSLQKEWSLLWTTEKEINFFIDWNLCNQITQTLDNGILLNNIPFKKGGSFGVKGKLSTVSSETFNDDSNDLRTDFEFESATLDLDKWGTYTFPPVGKGWFDTIYLDDSFRVDVNSRNDILICKS